MRFSELTFLLEEAIAILGRSHFLPCKKEYLVRDLAWKEEE
jgi:hypothetical protein